MKDKKMIIAIAAAVILLIVALFSGKGDSNKTSKVQASGNYKTVTDISGISFIINESIANKATAVSEISEKIDVEPNLYYVYKDGNSTYLLFCLDSIIIAAEKGTSFHFNEYEKKEDAVYADSVAGLWFETNGNKFAYEEQGSLFIANVNAGLVITNDMYNDYVGQLAVLSDGETEWSVFAGVPGTTKFKDLPESTREGIQTIVQSLEFSSYVAEIPEENYAVVIGTGETETVETAPVTDIQEELIEETIEEPVEETLEENVEVQDEEPEEVLMDEEDSAEESPVEENPENEEKVSDEETGDSEQLPVKELPVEEPAIEEIPLKPIENEKNEEDIVEENPSEDISEDVQEENVLNKEETDDSKKTINLQNQNYIKNKTKDKAYTSDIYSMLSLGDNGIIIECDISTGIIESPVINVKTIHTGVKAQELIKDYCNRTGAYNYFDAPEGCTWHVAEYYLSYENCTSEPYINIKLKGVDGQKLRFRGINYTQRSYDIADKVSENNGFVGPFYSYYSVPNGCPEYVLECGTGNIDSPIAENNAAYYLIK